MMCYLALELPHFTHTLTGHTDHLKTAYVGLLLQHMTADKL